MPERSSASPARPARGEIPGEAPPPDVAEFIRYCHRRRHVGWPELYDEMCAVAARREFNDWGRDQLAERGVTFTLTDMPRLAAWVRLVTTGAPRPRQVPSAKGQPHSAPGMG